MFVDFVPLSPKQAFPVRVSTAAEVIVGLRPGNSLRDAALCSANSWAVLMLPDSNSTFGFSRAK
jgi:hypothetical protein